MDDNPIDSGPGEGGLLVEVGERYPPCLAALRGTYADLTGAERRVADHVLGDPGRVLLSSSAEVAVGSGVGVGTLARLCAKLGYAGFPEMKIALAVELFNPGGVGASGWARGGGDAHGVVREAFRAGMQNLADTEALLDPEEMERAAEAIAGAGRVELYAQGPATGSVAHIFQSRFLLAGVSCTVHTHVGYQHIAAGLLGAEDVAIGLSQSGETEPVIRALGAANEAGATTLCVTNARGSSLAREARVRLYAASGGEGPASHRPGSLVAMLAVIEALQALTLLNKGCPRRE